MRSSKDEKLRTAQISPDTPKIEPVILVVITFAVVVVQAVVEDFAVVFFLVEEAVAVEAEVVMIVEEGGSDRGGRLARELIWGPLLALHTSVHFIAFSTLIVYCFQQTRCKRLVFALIDLFSIHFIHFSKNKSRLRSHP